MNRAVPAFVFLAIAAGVAWFVLSPRAEKSVKFDDSGDAAESGDSQAPTELAAGPASVRKDRAKAARSVGASQLSGVVRRGGVAAAAKVEVHWVMAPDANPFSRRKSGYFQRLVEAPPSERDAEAVATAGDDGRFTIDGLGAGIYEVRASTDDGARGASPASIPVDGAWVEANVDVDGGSEVLLGRVVHADGTPWAGIVLVEPGSGSTRMGFPGLSSAAVTTKSDATGAFQAKGLKAGDVTVTAIEPGVFRVSGMAVHVPTSETFVLTIDDALAAMKGKVVADADGSPIAGAAVAGGGQGGGFSFYVAQTTSGADGSFEVRMPAGRQSGLMVTADGFATGMWQGREAKEGEPIEIRLAKWARIVGRVTRTGSEPVAKARVRATSLAGRNSFEGSDGVTSGPDGRYEIADAAPGDVMIVAEAPGLVTKGIGEVSGKGYNPLAVMAKPGETTTIDVEMVPGAKASGTVGDSAGTPVRGALVSATGGADGPGVMRLDGSTGGTSAVSGVDGSFVIDPLVPGKAYTFFADRAGFARAKSEAVMVSEAAPAVVALRFAPVRLAEISVLDDATGTGVAGARVNANGSSGRRIVFGTSGYVTGADGRVKIGPLDSGDLRIDVSADDYIRSNDQPPILSDGAPSLVVRIRKGLPIAGKVLLPDLTPAVGAEVQVDFRGESGRGWIQPMTTGADGAFRMRGILAGTVTLNSSLSKDGKSYSARTKVTVGAEDVAITMQESGKGGATSGEENSLVVRVLDPDGKTVPTANARYRAGSSSSGQNVQDGRVTFQRGDKSVGTVDIWGAKSRSGVPLNFAPARREVRADETEIEIRLGAGVSMEGRVRGPDGVGLKGVQVSVTPGRKEEQDEGFDGRGNWGAYGTARADATGAFRIDGLSDEDYTIFVQAPPEFMPYDGPAVRGGSKAVDVALKTGLTALVTVVDDAGKPVAGANVSVMEMKTSGGGGGGGGGTRQRGVSRSGGTTDAAGVARASGLSPAAVYRISVHANEFIAWSQSPWAPADTVVHLDRSFSISGVVKDTSGKPVARATVHWSKDKSGWNGNQSGVDGRFRLDGLPAGEVYVHASLGSGPETENEKDVQRVRSGSKDLALVVDVGATLTVKFENWPADAPNWQRPQLSLEGDTHRPFNGNPVDQVSPDGLVNYRGLRDDETYRLWVPPLPGGLCAVMFGIKAGGEVRVRLIQGKAITGRITAPEGADNVNIQMSSNGMWAQGKVDADGRYTIDGLPDGTYDIHAGCRKDGAWWSATGKVAAGATLDLELKKR